MILYFCFFYFLIFCISYPPIFVFFLPAHYQPFLWQQWLGQIHLRRAHIPYDTDQDDLQITKIRYYNPQLSAGENLHTREYLSVVLVPFLVSFCSMRRNLAEPQNRNQKVRCSSIARSSGGSFHFNSSDTIANNTIFSSNPSSLVAYHYVLKSCSKK